MRAVLPAHGTDAHRPNGPDPIPATYAIKLVADDTAVATGTVFIWTIPRDVSGTYLRDLEVYLTTAGSTTTELQLENLTTANDMLSVPAQLDSGDEHSDDGLPLLEIDTTGTPAANYVTWKDQVAFVVNTAGTGAMGLGVEVKFGQQRVTLTP